MNRFNFCLLILYIFFDIIICLICILINNNFNILICYNISLLVIFSVILIFYLFIFIKIKKLNKI